MYFPVSTPLKFVPFEDLYVFYRYINLQILQLKAKTYCSDFDQKAVEQKKFQNFRIIYHTFKTA